MDDPDHTCSCDEYIAGMKSMLEIDRSKKKLTQKRPVRMWVKTDFSSRLEKSLNSRVQLRCCFQSNKIINITSCAYSGQRYLPAPWDTKIRTNYELGTAAGTTRQAIQTFQILCGLNVWLFFHSPPIQRWLHTSTLVPVQHRPSGCYW